MLFFRNTFSKSIYHFCTKMQLPKYTFVTDKSEIK